MEARPGTTHHGPPMQVIDCGKTEIDEETFQDYIVSLQEMYTASAYHLIDFNCNHFTADLVGFLSGATIPSWISGQWTINLETQKLTSEGLPTEFLSTPFGQAMRPQIDAMFRRTAPSEHPVAGNSPPTPVASGSSSPSPHGSSLLASIAAQATAPSPAPTLTPDTSPLTLVSSMSNFNSILKQHPAVVVNFTNTPGCPPCRVMKPVFETIASNCAVMYAGKGVRFVEVELGIGEGRDIASGHKVHATPTFMFFQNGNKVDELKGASKKELEMKVETFLEECFPRHPHYKLYLPATEAIPLQAIVSGTLPAFPALLSKLESFGVDGEKVSVLRDRVVPLLEGKVTPTEPDLRSLFTQWTTTSNDLLAPSKPEATFPIIDLWRVGLLSPRISSLLALNLSPSVSPAADPISSILSIASSALATASASTPKPFLLTVLRLLTNLLAPLPLANVLLSSASVSPLQNDITSILVESLLHPDTSVRSTAAGVAMNLASWRHRIAKEQRKGADEMEENASVVEEVSALVEAIGRESDEDVAHRLLAALALLAYLSPSYMSSVQPLLEVLGTKGVIEGKMKGYKKKDVKKLAEEIAGKLC